MRRSAFWGSVWGAVVCTIALAVVHASVLATPAYPAFGTSRFPWIAAFGGVLATTNYAVGLPDRSRSQFHAALLAAAAWAGSALVISLAQLTFGEALLPRFVVFGSAGVNVMLQVAMSSLSASSSAREQARDRVYLVVSIEELVRLGDELHAHPELGATIAGSITPGEAAVLNSGNSSLIVDRVHDARANVLVLDRSAQSDQQIIAQAGRLHEAGIRVRTLEAFYAEWLAKLPSSELERVSLFFDIGEVHNLAYSRAKRVLDIVVALVGMIPLAILFPFVALGNVIGNRGPLLYRQVRVGKDGRHFEILKFRTMSTGAAPQSAGEWTAENDPRITPFGRLLRRTHLDEAPQMINILRGDLSVVGPRPEQPHYVAELSEKLPFYHLRHLVRPGLTGWAQVKYGYAGSERDSLEKLQYEFYYLAHQDLRFDVRVIVRTVRSLFGGEGAGR